MHGSLRSRFVFVAPVAAAILLGSAARLAGPNADARTPAASGGAAHSVPPPLAPELEPVARLPELDEVFEELDTDRSPAKIALGEKLFHDPRLSHDDTISCASCHDLRYAGIDRSATATGIRGQIGALNTPTVFNAALSIAQFWDGRAIDLPTQADGPPTAPGEMGSTWPEIVGKLARDARLVDDFRAAFPDAVRAPTDIRSEHVLESISQFEATLLTPDSPFDRWLAGDTRAITQRQYDGYQTFKAVGCATCHYGASIGGKSFQRLGVKREYFVDERIATHVDNGRYNVTKDARDMHVFKVPTLRNVAVTGPWLHDGSHTTLEQVVRTMAHHQLDRALTPEQALQIVAFLESLTGTWRGRSLARAASPRH